MSTDPTYPTMPAGFTFHPTVWEAFLAEIRPPAPLTPEAQRAREEAIAFADSLGGHLAPAERDALIDLLTQAGVDDAQHGVATFIDGTQGSRVEQTKALYAPRPTQATPAPEQKYTNDELLAMTPGGRKALEWKKKREAAFSRAGLDPERRRLLEMTPGGRQTLRRLEEEYGR